MNLIPHVWTNIKYAWSIRFNVLAGAMILFEPALQDFFSDHIWRSTWSQLLVRVGIGLVNLGAIAAKLTWQPKLHQEIAKKEMQDGLERQQQQN